MLIKDGRFWYIKIRCKTILHKNSITVQKGIISWTGLVIWLPKFVRLPSLRFINKFIWQFTINNLMKSNQNYWHNKCFYIKRFASLVPLTNANQYRTDSLHFEGKGMYYSLNMFLKKSNLFSQLTKRFWWKCHIWNWAQFCKEIPHLFLEKRWETCSISFDWIVASAPCCLKKTSPSIGLFSRKADMR